MSLIQNCYKGKYLLLKKEEVYTLITKIQAGDKAAEDRLVRHNLGLVHKVALKHSYAADGVIGQEDLFQEGVLGLIRAFKTFDIARNFDLSTYALPWIEQAVGRFIDNNRGPVRTPIYLQVLKRKYAKLKKDDSALHNDDFYLRLACAEQDTPPSALRHAITYTPRDVRVDMLYPEGGEVFQLADVVDENGLDLARMDFEELLNKLGSEKRHVIERRLMGWTLEKIGGLLGISRERVRQIEEAAILRMKAMINDVKANRTFELRDKLNKEVYATINGS